MYRIHRKRVLNCHSGSNPDLCYIQNRAIKRFMCSNFETARSYFLIQVKEMLSFIHRGLKTWGIHIHVFGDEKVYPQIYFHA